jgi:hypothetical protein
MMVCERIKPVTFIDVRECDIVVVHERGKRGGESGRGRCDVRVLRFNDGDDDGRCVRKLRASPSLFVV